MIKPPGAPRLPWRRPDPRRSGYDTSIDRKNSLRGLRRDQPVAALGRAEIAFALLVAVGIQPSRIGYSAITRRAASGTGAARPCGPAPCRRSRSWSWPCAGAPRRRSARSAHPPLTERTAGPCERRRRTHGAARAAGSRGRREPAHGARCGCAARGEPVATGAGAVATGAVQVGAGAGAVPAHVVATAGGLRSRPSRSPAPVATAARRRRAPVRATTRSR